MRVALFLGIAYLAATVALVGISGCSLPSTDAQECFGIEDCDDDRICFLGTCQDPGYSIQSVHAVLTPPNDSPYLPQQTAAPVDLGAGYQKLFLSPTLTITGRVSATDEPGVGTLYARKQGTLEGHPIVSESAVDRELGFSLRVVPGTYALRFVPSAGTDGTQAKPPLAYGTVSLTEDRTLDLGYPTGTELLVLSGRVLYTSTAMTGVAGALISATAQDAVGKELTSTDAVTDASGTYTLVLPPGAIRFDVNVRPEANPLVPETTLLVERTIADPSRLEDIVLGVSTDVFVEATVRDAEGAPVPRARVYFAGSEIGDVHGTFARQIETDADGRIGRTALLPGDYVVTVVPGKSQPQALSQTRIDRLEQSPAEPLALTVGGKVRVSGTVRDSGGAPVDAARLILTLRDAPAQREYTTVTTADGLYEMEVDPGQYELVAEPPAGTAANGPLPRHRELVAFTRDIATIIHDVHLYPAVIVYGRVLDPEGGPVTGVTIAFYSAELAANGEPPVLVGLGLTSSTGEFAVALPTPEAR